MLTNKSLIALYTMVHREVQRIVRIWIQTILPPVITMSLYFIIFGNLIGSRIGNMDGLRYIDYIVPGLIMMSIITNSYANVVSSFFGSKFQKNIEEMLVAPMSYSVILWGFLSGGIFRGLVVGLIVTFVASWFTDITLVHPWITFVIAFLTATLFSIAGILNAIFARKFDDVSIVPTFVLTPLTYLGGIFYTIDLLPEFWQKITHINPIFYMINAFRYGMLGVSDVNITTSIGVIFVFIVAFYFLAYYLLAKGVGIRN